MLCILCDVGTIYSRKIYLLVIFLKGIRGFWKIRSEAADQAELGNLFHHYGTIG